MNFKFYKKKYKISPKVSEQKLDFKAAEQN